MLFVLLRYPPKKAGFETQNMGHISSCNPISSYVAIYQIPNCISLLKMIGTSFSGRSACRTLPELGTDLSVFVHQENKHIW
jgi:hypothetical protein